MKLRACVFLTAVLALGTLPGRAQSGAASIEGRVTYSGTPPAPHGVKMTADPKCAALHPDGVKIAVVEASGNGGLAHAFVWLKTGVEGRPAPPTEPVVLDQLGCEFEPRIVVVHTDQPLAMRNSDDTLHNVHPRPVVNREFNIGQTRAGMVATRTFDRQEVMIPVSCDIHPWMKAYVAVVDHPYFAVTDGDGAFEIKDVPPGDYEVEVWHETLGRQTLKVTVTGAEAVRANFAYRR